MGPVRGPAGDVADPKWGEPPEVLLASRQREGLGDVQAVRQAQLLAWERGFSTERACCATAGMMSAIGGPVRSGCAGHCSNLGESPEAVAAVFVEGCELLGKREAQNQTTAVLDDSSRYVQ